jgi:hypothetical protein
MAAPSEEKLICDKGLGAIRAKIGPTSDVDKIFSKMYSNITSDK